jgi:sRNA-binding protein
MAAGGSRYDIDGKPAGVIGPDDQKSASEALQRQRYRSPQAIAAKKARWEAKKAATAAQP